MFGDHTRLAVQNFPAETMILGDVPAMVSAYAQVKSAAARANRDVGRIDAQVAEWIVRACQKLMSGRHFGQFVSPLVGGGGTSTNMNLNEVISAVAEKMARAEYRTVQVHPLDHVNASQSTNDTYPTAMAVALLELAEAPLESLVDVAETLEAKAQEYADLTHLGRTCLRDALPRTAGDTHRAQATAVRRATAGLRRAVEPLHSVPLGATAVGTGASTPPGHRNRTVQYLAESTGRPITLVDDPFDALANLDHYQVLSDQIVRAALVLARISADLRLLSSGPTGGIGEVRLPALQPGSSMMPGKVNPVIPEYVMQLSYRIRGSAYTVECAVSAGDLELNVMAPVIAQSLVAMLHDLEAAARGLADRVIPGLTWDRERTERNLAGSMSEVVDRAAKLGYDAAQADQDRPEPAGPPPRGPSTAVVE